MATVVRPATTEDARPIGELQLRAWWRAYQDIVEPALLCEHDADAREENWRGLLARGGAGEIRVVEVAGQVCGVVSIGDGELLALYVDPPAQGAGIGSLLLQTAEDELRARGAERMTGWVFEENGLARTFLERHGWAADGESRGGGWAPELRYAKDLRA